MHLMTKWWDQTVIMIGRFLMIDWQVTSCLLKRMDFLFILAVHILNLWAKRCQSVLFLTKETKHLFFFFPVFSELWSGHQAAGRRLCFTESNQTRGDSLWSFASATSAEGLSGSRMSRVESQQVAGGMFVLPGISSGFDHYCHRLQPAETQAQTEQKASQRLQMWTRTVQSPLSLSLFKSNVTFPVN